MEETLAEVERVGTRCNAITAMTCARAEELKGISAERIAAGHPARRLEGVPFAVKDVIDVAGYPTTMGSAVRSDAAATVSSPVVTRLEEAGAIPVAKTNCQEYSYGILGDESVFGRVINPVDPALCTAGSSSGSAALVAAGAVPLALGTDTAGSVRVPAACQGVLGFKPSFGAVPTDGVFPLSPAFDTVGLFAADLGLLTAAFAAMAGTEPQQPTVGGTAVGGAGLGELVVDLSLLDGSATSTLRAVVADRLAAVPTVTVTSGDTAVAGNIATSANGQILRELIDECAPIYDVIRRYEAFAVHRGLIADRAADYQPGVRAKILSGRSIDEQEYRQNLDALDELRARSAAVFDTVDFLLTSVIDGPVIRWDAITADSATKFMRYSMPFNVLGWPALTIPVAGGAATHDLPQTVQLVGPPGSDHTLLELAAQF